MSKHKRTSPPHIETPVSAAPAAPPAAADPIDTAPVSEKARQQPAARRLRPPDWRRAWASVRGAAVQSARGAVAQGAWFWVVFFLVLGTGALLRTFRMDMPPIDFPADRQHTNAATIELLRQGEPLLNLRNPFMELRLYAWITARTSFLCRLFGCEIWTLARFWSAAFGVLAIAMAALAGYWAAATPGNSRGRRQRIALLFMAALAFNPYHWQLSRMISTESFTLAMQMCAVAFFWVAWRHPRNLAAFAAFGVFFILMGWAKIPSMIWLPGFALYLLGHPVTRGRAGRAGLIGLGVFVVGIIAMFWISGINPFRIFKEFEKNYPYFAQHTQLWMGSALWTKTYLSRIVLMLTLPGTVLALAGLLAAPWLFRITAAVFLVVFYGLINLNTYNFCHIIIPGMALAAWGANALIESASGESAAALWRAWGAGLERWQRRINMALGCLVVLALVLLLFPAGPDGRPRPQPRGEVLQALEVVKQHVPKGTWVYHDDGENSFSYMTGQGDNSFAPDKLDLRTGYYYLFERFNDRPLLYAGAGWPKWASLPGEPGGILFTRPPAEPAAAELAKMASMNPVAGGPLTTATLELTTGTVLAAENCFLPAESYDAARRVLMVHPGKAVTIGVAWQNPRNFTLAGVRWESARWGQRHITAPVRTGGFAIGRGGVLCLPDGKSSRALYTFEIPPGFPAGEYTMEYYPLSPGPWHPPERGEAVTLPFKIVCDTAEVPPEVIDVPFRQLYPNQYTISPFVWSGRWRYRNMKLEGYSFGGTIDRYLLACPMRPPGVYEITIRGEAEPLTGSSDPEESWPQVDVYLPGDLETSAARVVLNSRSTGEFKATFTAMQPFDGLMLKAVGDFGEEPPLWPTDFIPAKLGRQVLVLRSLRLAPQRQILPGLADELK